MSAVKINPETLEHEGTVAMPGVDKILLVAPWQLLQMANDIIFIIFTITFHHSAGQHSDGQNIIFTDGEYINQIAACKDVSLKFWLKLFKATKILNVYS